jgi:hypothetical protein
MAWKAARPAGGRQPEAASQVRATEVAAVALPAARRPLASPAPPASPSAVAMPSKPAASPNEPADRAAPFEVRAFPPEAEIVLDGRQALVGRLQIVLPLAGSSHEIRVSAPGYDAKTISFGGEQGPPAEIRLDRAQAPVQRSGAKKKPRGQRVTPTKRGTNDAMIIK